MFFCPGCCGVLNGRSMKAFIEDIKASSAPPAGSGVVDDLTNQLKQLTNTVATLGGKVDALTAINKTAGSTTTQYASVLAGTRGTKRRRSDEHSVPASKTGTKSVVFEKLSISNITPKPDPPRFWLYLAGFNPLITNDDIKLIVSQCMGIPDLQPDVTRLVKKGADTSRLSFVSFKVGLDPEHESLALEDIWPEGISFREFEDWSKNSTDQPPVANDADFPMLNPGST